MQKLPPLTDFIEITPAAASVATNRHGWRAKCLQRLVRLGLPVPQTVALPFATVRAIAAGQALDCPSVLSHFGVGALISVRPGQPDWGGPATILNIGLNAATHERLAQSHGRAAADALVSEIRAGLCGACGAS